MSEEKSPALNPKIEAIHREIEALDIKSDAFDESVELVHDSLFSMASRNGIGAMRKKLRSLKEERDEWKRLQYFESLDKADWPDDVLDYMKEYHECSNIYSKEPITHKLALACAARGNENLTKKVRECVKYQSPFDIIIENYGTEEWIKAEEVYELLCANPSRKIDGYSIHVKGDGSREPLATLTKTQFMLRYLGEKEFEKMEKDASSSVPDTAPAQGATKGTILGEVASSIASEGEVLFDLIKFFLNSSRISAYFSQDYIKSGPDILHHSKNLTEIAQLLLHSPSKVDEYWEDYQDEIIEQAAFLNLKNWDAADLIRKLWEWAKEARVRFGIQGAFSITEEELRLLEEIEKEIESSKGWSERARTEEGVYNEQYPLKDKPSTPTPITVSPRMSWV